MMRKYQYEAGKKYLFFGTFIGTYKKSGILFISYDTFTNFQCNTRKRTVNILFWCFLERISN
jgi:hypothetical protein